MRLLLEEVEFRVVSDLHPHVLDVIPRRGTAGSAGYDLIAAIREPIVVYPQEPAVLIPTGIKIYINNPLYVGLIFPRSGLGHKKGLVLGNGTGVIDSDYQGEIMVSAWNRNPKWSDTPGDGSICINPGDRIAQLVFTRIATPKLVEVVAFDTSERGEKGFGSTGVDNSAPVTPGMAGCI